MYAARRQTLIYRDITDLWHWIILLGVTKGAVPVSFSIEVTENSNTDDSDPEECFMCVENSSQNMSGFERRFN